MTNSHSNDLKFEHVEITKKILCLMGFFFSGIEMPFTGKEKAF